MRSVSCRLRSVKMPGKSMPGIGGRIGAARRCQDQFIVRLVRLLARRQIANPHGLRLPVDRLHRRADPHIEIESGKEPGGSDDQQLLAVGNFASQDSRAVHSSRTIRLDRAQPARCEPVPTSAVPALPPTHLPQRRRRSPISCSSTSDPWNHRRGTYRAKQDKNWPKSGIGSTASAPTACPSRRCR